MLNCSKYRQTNSGIIEGRTWWKCPEYYPVVWRWPRPMWTIFSQDTLVMCTHETNPQYLQCSLDVISSTLEKPNAGLVFALQSTHIQSGSTLNILLFGIPIHYPIPTLSYLSMVSAVVIIMHRSRLGNSTSFYTWAHSNLPDSILNSTIADNLFYLSVLEKATWFWLSFPLFITGSTGSAALHFTCSIFLCLCSHSPLSIFQTFYEQTTFSLHNYPH